jgi:hypothetical protein
MTACVRLGTLPATLIPRENASSSGTNAVYGPEHQCSGRPSSGLGIVNRISLLLVEIHVGAGNQSFHDGGNGTQESEMQFTQRERRVDLKNPGCFLRRDDQGSLRSKEHVSRERWVHTDDRKAP